MRRGRSERQEKMERKKEVDEYKRMELPGKYMAKLLYGWDDQEFEEEYLKKLEKNWKRWKSDRKEVEREEDKQVEKIIWGKVSQFLQRRNLKKGVMLRLLKMDFIFLF